MKLKQCALYLLAAGMIATGANTAAAAEQNEATFAALSNVEAQSLSIEEMQSITGAALSDLLLSKLAPYTKSPDLRVAAAAQRATQLVIQYAALINSLFHR